MRKRINRAIDKYVLERTIAARDSADVHPFGSTSTEVWLALHHLLLLPCRAVRETADLAFNEAVRSTYIELDQ